MRNIDKMTKEEIIKLIELGESDKYECDECEALDFCKDDSCGETKIAWLLKDREKISIKEMIKILKDKDTYVTSPMLKGKSAYDNVITALEKEIAKKPLGLDVRWFLGKGFENTGICPHCGNHMAQFENVHRCSVCGQNLKWPDHESNVNE
jgi:hypothetical protein